MLALNFGTLHNAVRLFAEAVGFEFAGRNGRPSHILSLIESYSGLYVEGDLQHMFHEEISVIRTDDLRRQSIRALLPS